MVGKALLLCWHLGLDRRGVPRSYVPVKREVFPKSKVARTKCVHRRRDLIWLPTYSSGSHFLPVGAFAEEQNLHTMQKQQLSPFGKPEYVLHFQHVPSSLLWLFSSCQRCSDQCPTSFRIWLSPLCAVLTESVLKIFIIWKSLPIFLRECRLLMETNPQEGEAWKVKPRHCFWSRRFNIRAFRLRIQKQKSVGNLLIILVCLSYKILTILSTKLKIIWFRLW